MGKALDTRVGHLETIAPARGVELCDCQQQLDAIGAGRGAVDMTTGECLYCGKLVSARWGVFISALERQHTEGAIMTGYSIHEAVQQALDAQRAVDADKQARVDELRAAAAARLAELRQAEQARQAEYAAAQRQRKPNGKRKNRRR